MKLIVGSGGGGKDGGSGSSHTPVDEIDSLQSHAFAKVIDLVAEGEIVGLVNGRKSIYLDGTPVENPDGSQNFTGVKHESRTGTQDQSYMVGFESAENEVVVGVEVKHGPTGIVRTITNESVDAVRVRVSVPQLTYQHQDTGDLTGTFVAFRILLQSNGTGFQEVVSDQIVGKCVSKYERSYRVDLTGDGPWDIKVERLTDDSIHTYLQNRTFWESYAEIVDGKMRYPNSAIVALTVDSKQFSSIPTRGYDLKLLKVRVPDNSTTNDDGSLTYSGTWGGGFRISWTTNPAWILYDLITSSRYGLGDFIPASHVDKWALYTIGRYCDELVPDGDGGYEPRFTCNMYLQTRAEAYKVLQDLASSFRGMMFWAEGTISAVQDSPSDAAHLFTTANVVDGVFSYSGSSAKARHTVALVTWNDPQDLYRQKIEYVEDDEAIARFGVIETSIVAFGCTSRAQAHRAGKWLLYSERYQTEIVSFKTGLGGAVCRPGQVIKVADPARAGSRRGGRIVSATTSSIIVDQDLAIDPSTHSVSVLLSDGTVEERSISTASGSEIILITPFSQAPQSGSVWLVSSTAIEAQTFKVVGIAEEPGGVYAVTAVAHDPQKYGVIEQGLKLEPRSISSLSSVPGSPQNVQLVETLYEVSADVRVKLTISWDNVAGASSYVAQYYRNDGNIISLPATTSNDIEILNAEPGTYTVKIWAVSPFGVRSIPTEASVEVVGKARPPGDVQNFSLIPMGGVAYLSWTKSVDLDVLLGGVVRIRHTPDLVTPQWKNAVDIVPALPGNATRAQAPLIPGTYMAKFVDSSGNASTNAVLLETTVPQALALNVVQTINEAPTFLGTLTNMERYPYLDGIALSAISLIDDVTDLVDTIANFDFAGGVASSGSYDFQNVVDLGNPFTSRVTATIEAGAIDVADTIDLRVELVDAWADLDGAFIDDVNAELFMATTLDDPSSPSATWTDWKRFFVGEYHARGLKFQLRVTSGSYSHNLAVTGLSVVVDMPDRTLNLNGLVSGMSTYSVAFAEPFMAVPSLGITASNMISGDYWTIANKTRSGFDITFRDASNTIVSRTFDVLVKGYGRQVS